jgi:hypothetical protein
MNNTTTTTKRNLTIVAIFMAATLVVGIGTFTTTTQSVYAYQKKGGGEDNGKGNDNGNTVTIEECKNRGSASGFDTALDQECENLICTHPGENATCVQEGVVTTTTATTPPPVKLTCEECFRKFLNADQIRILTLGTNDFTFVCQRITFGTAEELQRALVSPVIGLSESAAAQLIQCLIDAGVQFGTRPT